MQRHNATRVDSPKSRFTLSEFKIKFGNIYLLDTTTQRPWLLEQTT